MRLLLDTHIALWLAIARERLTAEEFALIEAPDSELLFSAVSIWELRLKWHSFHISGERKGPADPKDIHAILLGYGLAELQLSAHHAETVLSIPMQHRDPFDELLLAQAQLEGLRLFTRNAKLISHPLAIAP